MTVETNANFISELNRTFPRNRDLIKEGDDHIRLIKGTLQNTFPGITSAVTFTSDKLNKLDRTLVYEEDTLTINSSFKVAKGLSCDMGENIISGVADPEEPTDAVNLRSLQGAWPVGSVFMTIDSRNPNLILGFGNWSKFAAGRVIIGTGSTTDTNSTTRSFVNEQKGGSYQVKLSEDNLAPHTHKNTAEAEKGGTHAHILPSGGGSDGPREALSIDSNYDTGDHAWKYNKEGSRPATNTGGEHVHKIKVTNETTGKGTPFDTSPPFIACNIWVRNTDE